MSVGYVSVKPIINPASNVLRALYGLALPAGLTAIPLDKLHVTLMYDERNVVESDGLEIPPVIYPCSVTGVTVLGEAVALMLDSHSLMQRHLALLKAGFNHSFSTYLPHLSVVGYSEDTAALQQAKDQIQTLWDNKQLPVQLYLTDEQWSVCD